MSAIPSERTPLARLVLFVICIAIAGSILAGAHYYAIDLPEQQQVPAVPENSGYNDCLSSSEYIYQTCAMNCYFRGWPGCLNQCAIERDERDERCDKYNS